MESADAFFERLAEARDAVLFLDYDGTLAPFHAERGRAIPYAGVAQRLRDLPATRVVVVSGRPAQEVVALLGLSPEVWGVHGLERRFPDGRLERRELSIEADEALAHAERWARHHLPPALIEPKPGTLAIHVRGLDAAEAQRISGLTRDLFASLAGTEVTVRSFDGGLELRPVGVHKGLAVRGVMAEVPGAAAAFLGDDLTDEDAFAALNDLDPPGLGVLVRTEPRPSLAGLHLRPPGELLDFLDRWSLARARAAREDTQ